MNASFVDNQKIVDTQWMENEFVKDLIKNEIQFDGTQSDDDILERFGVIIKAAGRDAVNPKKLIRYLYFPVSVGTNHVEYTENRMEPVCCKFIASGRSL